MPTQLKRRYPYDHREPIIRVMLGAQSQPADPLTISTSLFTRTKLTPYLGIMQPDEDRELNTRTIILRGSYVESWLAGEHPLTVRLAKCIPWPLSEMEKPPVSITASITESQWYPVATTTPCGAWPSNSKTLPSASARTTRNSSPIQSQPP